MPVTIKRRPKSRKPKYAGDPLLLISRIVIDATALMLLYLFLHLHWGLL